MPVVVAINQFTTDTEKELNLVKTETEKYGVKAIVSNVWAKGGKGAIDLAKEVIDLCKQENNFEFSYDVNDNVEKKLNDIATKIYGAKGIKLTEKAKADLKDINELKFDKLPVIIAKTQYSLSDNAKLLGAPKDFEIEIKELQIRGGAGFIVAIAGSMLLMPGLPKVPAGQKMTIDNDGVIAGLF